MQGESLEQFPGMFPPQCLICISILAPLVFAGHVERPVTSGGASGATPSTVGATVSLARRLWKEHVLPSQGRNGEWECVCVCERERREEEERAMKVKARHGCRWLVPPSLPSATHSPHTAFSLRLILSLPLLLLLPLSSTHNSLSFDFFVLLFIIRARRARTRPRALHSFRFLLTLHTPPPLCWSFIQHINRNLHRNIHRQRRSPKFRWGHRRMNNGWSRASAWAHAHGTNGLHRTIIRLIAGSEIQVVESPGEVFVRTVRRPHTTKKSRMAVKTPYSIHQQ